MAMSGTDMANSIRLAMGFPLPTSNELIGWGTGIVQHLTTTGIVNHALVTGVTVPGGAPLQDGAAAGGIISGLDESILATLVVANAGYPFVSSQLLAFCQQIVLHLQTIAKVEFEAGEITGVCTSTGGDPGPLSAGAGTGGQIQMMDGDVLADLIHASVGYPGGTSTQLKAFCNAIVDYIQNNAEVTYASGQVTGTCPAGGGPLASGVAIGGLIS